jgi:hypothetical protein
MMTAKPVRFATALPLTVAALLALGAGSAPASAGAAPAAAGHAGNDAAPAPGSLSGAHLDGRRLMVTAGCNRDGRVEARVAGHAPVGRAVACRRGHARAVLRLPGPARDLDSAAVTIVVRAGGRPAPARLHFRGRSSSSTARSTQWSSADGNALCTTTPTVIDIGTAPSASFGLPAGTRFGWESWIYYVNAHTGASGYQRYGAVAHAYAGYSGSGYQRWYPYPGFWIRPMLHVTAPGVSLFDGVDVNGGFPYPARSSQWCLW